MTGIMLKRRSHLFVCTHTSNICFQQGYRILDIIVEIEYNRSNRNNFRKFQIFNSLTILRNIENMYLSIDCKTFNRIK